MEEIPARCTCATAVKTPTGFLPPFLRDYSRVLIAPEISADHISTVMIELGIKVTIGAAKMWGKIEKWRRSVHGEGKASDNQTS